tara:strand:+ start:1315 stop:1641 length:327 start_codon:yes stop_codon:yes gene_type:complete
MLLEYTRPNIHLFGDLILKPGMNSVSDATVKGFNTHLKKCYEDLLDQGVIIEHKKNVRLTKRIIESTADLDTLNSWLADDTVSAKMKKVVAAHVADITSVAEEVEEVV